MVLMYSLLELDLGVISHKHLLLTNYIEYIILIVYKANSHFILLASNYNQFSDQIWPIVQ